MPCCLSGVIVVQKMTNVTGHFYSDHALETHLEHMDDETNGSFNSYNIHRKVQLAVSKASSTEEAYT